MNNKHMNMSELMNDRFFNRLYHYYKSFYTTDKYKYKIMITRRSYVLYKIFENIFIQENILRSGQFYNSNSFTLINDNTPKDKVLIIDDIVINGRTIRKLKRKLSNKFSDENISIRSFLINKYSSLLNYELNLNLLQPIHYVSEKLWRESSNKLTSLIINSSYGYTSFVNTYTLKGIEYNNLKSKMENYKCIVNELDNDVFQKNNIKACVSFINADQCNIPEQSKTFFKLLNNYNIHSCVRIYNYNINDKKSITIIPYVFLPSVKKENFKEYLSKLLSCIHVTDTDYVQKTNELINNLESDENILFAYRWLIYFLSECTINAFRHFFVESGKDINFEKKLQCEESFKKYYINFTNFEIDEIDKKIDNILISPNKIQQSSEQECYDLYKMIFNEYIEDSNTKYELLRKYLFNVRTLDQTRAEQGQERLNGIRKEDILCIEKHLNIDTEYYKLLTDFIKTWDCGDASYCINILGNKDNQYICETLINGEQIYRYSFVANKQVVVDFRMFFANTLVTDIIELNKFAKYMDTQLGSSDYSDFIKTLNQGLEDDFKNNIEISEFFECSKDMVRKNNGLVTRYVNYYLNNKDGENIEL